MRTLRQAAPLRRLRWAVCVPALASVGFAPTVDPELPAYSTGSARLSGQLVVTGGPLMAAWSEGFQRIHPEIRMIFAKPGATPWDDLKALRDGKVQVVEAGFQREMEVERRAGRAGPAPYAIAVSSGGTAYHPEVPKASPALAVYVNARNPIARMSLPELDAIYSTTRLRGYPRDLAEWGQLGLSGEWKGRPIHRYGMSLRNRDGTPHGYVYFWNERVMLGGEFKPGLVEVPDTAFGSGKNRAFVEILRDVAADPAGIAFAPFDFAAPGVKTLALAEGRKGPYYAGTWGEVQARVYPLTMTNYVSVMRLPRRLLDPRVQDFLAYLLSREGQAVIAAHPGHEVPLPAAFAAAERAKLD